jgi:hypothetical protein
MSYVCKTGLVFYLEDWAAGLLSALPKAERNGMER